MATTTASAPSATRAPVALDVAIIGGGPAGLMAAQHLQQHAGSSGLCVAVFDASASVGRKFLLAGRGGLNLTHAEPKPAFVTRYGQRQREVADWLQDFDAEAVRAWAQALGIDTFVGTSGRVFPTDMKAAPLLRAWLGQLRAAGVQFHMRHRWTGWSAAGELCFATPGTSGTPDIPSGELRVRARATVLALGGGSWARLGSDGRWLPTLAAAGVAVAPLQASNCGFDMLRPGANQHDAVWMLDRQKTGDNSTILPHKLMNQTSDAASHTSTAPASQALIGWSPFFASKFAGQPFKSVAIAIAADDDSAGQAFHRKGEFVATATGVEGSVIYAAAAQLRDTIAARGRARLHIDLLPEHSAARVLAALQAPRGARSLANHLKRKLGLDGIKTALLYEVLGKDGMQDTQQLAATIKAAPLWLHATRPIDEAISTAGGVRFDALTPELMCVAQPGLFCAGEMLDWEAPTGGYLLTAAMASGVRAARGVRRFLG
jgi:hypothetical protein